ncbi:putative GPI-anchored protein pfl2 isoform X2 [Nematostella vectensis]|uniref:putative GPI-anchored protein pfl2 isoform X2 n=1 Tax=Nematostella vectensis TaxID=45351 RepID=UPI002077796D|nr:putative GPI-anchored protein pfl2 isoform X2 [Nematostella vectensis]
MIQGKPNHCEQENGPVAVPIPKGWSRILENGCIVYISPSNSQLRSLDHVIEYLKKDGTCKCGLECPLYVHHAFNFDTRVPSKCVPEGQQEESRSASCKLCKHFSQNMEKQALVLEPRQQSKAKQSLSKGARQSTVNEKGSNQPGIKAETSKPKRAGTFRTRRTSSSSLTDIPSPPLQTTISSPVQNVPNNLGTSNQGPLPSFASIVSSSKFFNPGPHRGPLQPPTSMLPSTSLLSAITATTVAVTATSLKRTFDFAKTASVSASPVPISYLQTVSKALVTSTENSTSKRTKSLSSASSSAASLATTAFSTCSSSGSTFIAAHQLKSGNSGTKKTINMLNPGMAPNSALSRPKAASKPRARAKPKAAPKAKSKAAPLVNSGLSVGLLGAGNITIPQVSSSSWPAQTPSVLGVTSPSTTTYTSTAAVYPTAVSSLVSVASSTHMIQPSQAKTIQTASKTPPVWVPLSQLNYQIPPQGNTAASVTPGCKVVMSTLSSSQSQNPVTTSTSVATTSASLPHSKIGKTTTHPVAATQGVVYVDASQASKSTSLQHAVTSQAQKNPSSLVSANAGCTSNSTTQPAVSAVTSPASQAQGKMNMQIPAMYAASPVLPISTQNLNMGQYKGGAYHLQGAAMYPGTGMVANPMAFIAQPSKTSFANVPSPATQMSYPNPYMLGIVMPTTNVQQQSTSSHTSSTSTTTAAAVMPLTMMQQQNLSNSAVAAAYESFVPIAPASGGSTPRFSHTLAHLASAYNPFAAHGMVPNLQFTYRMMQMSAYAGNLQPTTIVTPTVPTTELGGTNHLPNLTKAAATSETIKSQASSLKGQSSESLKTSHGTETSTVTTQSAVSTSSSGVLTSVVSTANCVTAVGHPIERTPSLDNVSEVDSKKSARNLNTPVMGNCHPKPGNVEQSQSSSGPIVPTSTDISLLSTPSIQTTTDPSIQRDAPPVTGEGRVTRKASSSSEKTAAQNDGSDQTDMLPSAAQDQAKQQIKTNINEKKRVADDSSYPQETKRTKLVTNRQQYYESNPLLGMKRSCDAIEVYTSAPVESRGALEDNGDYSSSNEDIADQQLDDDLPIVLEDEPGKTSDLRDFKGDQDLYNGGGNKNHEFLPTHGMSTSSMPLKHLATPLYGMYGDTKPYFSTGDVVWAQARGLPSWPGQIVDESTVGKGHADEGKVFRHGTFGTFNYIDMSICTINGSSGLETTPSAKLKLKSSRH